MKKAILLLCAVVLAATTLTLTMTAADASKKKTLRHVVNFKFKSTASEAQVKEVVEAFRALKTKIPEIKEFEWGTNNSPENLNKGLTHCFILTFDSEEGRAKYLPHPDHKAFGAKLGPVLEDVFVIDYWAQE
jgi:hypothetical protein